MKILLLGCDGQVGWELQRSLQPLGEVVALDFQSRDYAADFSKPESLAATVAAIKPDLIVNSAAHTAVDKAESEPALAQAMLDVSRLSRDRIAVAQKCMDLIAGFSPDIAASQILEGCARILDEK